VRTRPQLIPWILTFAITGAAVVLRFVQLLLFTDSSTGRVTAAGAPLTYGLYALLLCASVCCTVCALHQSHTAVAGAADGGVRGEKPRALSGGLSGMDGRYGILKPTKV